MPKVVYADIHRGPHQESGNVVNGMLGAVAQQAQVSRVQQLFGIGAAAGPAAHFPDQPIPHFAVNRDIGHFHPPSPEDYSDDKQRAAKLPPDGAQKS